MPPLSIFDMLHNMRQIDDSTYAHSLNVALIARMLGEWMSWPEEDLETLTLAGLLHDIGKCMISPEILNKPALLSPDEYEEVKKHARYGAEILENQPIDKRIVLAALMHHERCDGSGYPLGLTTNDIDDFAKIKIQVGENTYDVCSGGNPNVILKMVEDKIAELHKQKVF